MTLFKTNKNNVEFFPKWTCPYEDCKKENDITNPVRCYNCNRKKPTKEEYQKIQANNLAKKKKQDYALTKKKTEDATIIEENLDEISQTATVETPKSQEQDLEFDLDKLESS
jgi:hypothetical protein